MINLRPFKFDELYFLFIDLIKAINKATNPPIKCPKWVKVITYKYEDATLFPAKNLPEFTKLYQPSI